MSTVMVAAAAALLLGFGIGFVFAHRSARVVALATSGLLAGTVIGLSASPVLAAAIAALVSLATAAIPLLLDKERRQAPSIDWLAPVAVFALVGILAGITLRVNNLLYFGDTSIRAELTAAGFTDDQVHRVMERWASNVEPSHIAAAGVRVSATALLGQRSNWTWRDLQTLGLPPDELVAHVRSLGTDDERRFIERLEREGRDTAAIVDALRQHYSGEAAP